MCIRCRRHSSGTVFFSGSRFPGSTSRSFRFASGITTLTAPWAAASGAESPLLQNAYGQFSLAQVLCSGPCFSHRPEKLSVFQVPHSPEPGKDNADGQAEDAYHRKQEGGSGTLSASEERHKCSVCPAVHHGFEYTVYQKAAQHIAKRNRQLPPP